MWCEKKVDGHYKFVERYTNPITNEQKKVSVTMNKNNVYTRKEAQNALNEKIEKIISKSCAYTKKDNITLYELVTLYREYQEHTVAKSTYKRNYYALETILNLLGENVIISNLSAGFVKTRFALNNDKPSTINGRYTRFKALIRWGYENDYISDIRFLDKIKPLPDKEKKKRLQEKYLEKEELAKLLDSMSVQKWKYLTELLALSGMRCGEAIALNITDIDFKDSVIHITKTYDVVNKIITSPKTSCSVRDVFMQHELKKLCKEIKSYTLEQKLMCGYKSKFFLCDHNGEHLNYFAYNKYLKETSLKCVGYSATTHVMRHTHVSLMAEAGVPLETITRRVGHENSDITKDVYLHITDKQKQKDNELIRNVSLL